MLAYLSGSIEYAPDNGKSWRAEITPFLRGLGHDVYDPAADEQKNLSDDEVRNFRSWKSRDLPRFQCTVRKIIAFGGRAFGDEQPKYLNSPETKLFDKGATVFKPLKLDLARLEGGQPLRRIGILQLRRSSATCGA